MAPHAPLGVGTIAVHRRRRRMPSVPSGELLLEPPPEPERAVPPGLLARALPAAMVLGSLGLVGVMGPGNPASWVFAGLFALSSAGMLVTGAPGRGGDRAAGLDEERRDYLRYLARMRREVDGVARRQRLALQVAHPAPAAWPEVIAAGRLWERAPADEDFAHVRVGTGAHALATPLVPPRTGPVEGLEPVAAQALRRFLAQHGVVAGLPVAVDLRACSAVWLDGDAAAAGALARAVVVQFALWHSPADARVAVLRAPAAAARWDWVKWLPHNAHGVERDALGGIRMISADPDDVRRWWAGEPARRHLLLVVDGPVETPGAWAASDGVTVLRVGVPAGRRATPSVVRLRPGEAGLDTDALTVAEALAFARRLARYRPETGERDAGAAPVHGLADLLGMRGAPSAGTVASLRRGRTAADRLRVPLGTDQGGQPVLLDLKESAHGGSGPHGLCVGATGSGKSELLRTLVLGLVLAHPPEELNLVLVDFKGGATFLGLAELPHVAAVITNLADELALVDRMADAIGGEVRRRQELLRAAGNLAGIAEYDAARAAGADLPPLPVLLLVVDEFSELLAQRPEMVDLFVMVGRLGRSLGLHLLLSSQRLDEGRLRGLESHLSYRIALRTFSAAESRAVLGVPDAFALPQMPGAAILAGGTDELVRFHSAYVSGPLAAESATGPSAARRPVPFGVEPVPVVEPAAAPAGRSLLDAAVEAVVAAGGAAAHRVWLPPLAEPPPLAALLEGGSWGGLRVPVGQIDRPARQRRDPLVVDLSGPAGHVVVAGGPRSGKSTTVRTLVTALALAHRPDEVGVHVLDLGGGSLDRLAVLPHVGTVAGRTRPALVRRVLAELTGLLTRREELFGANGIGSIEEFRTARAEGRFPDEAATDVVLVVDGYGTLCGTDLTVGDGAAGEDVAGRLATLAARGLAYGVHLVVTVGRWAELRPAVRDRIGTRLELRLGEPGDSEIDRRRARTVPPRAGHGLAPDGAAMVIADPAAPSAVPPGPAFPEVRLLPERVPAAPLLAGSGDGGLPLGPDEERLAVAEWDPAMDPHLVCFADAGGGKTALLRLVAHAVAAHHSPEQAGLVVLDPRRGLLGDLPDGYVMLHAGTPALMAGAAGTVAETMRGRLPGPEISPAQLRARSWWRGREVFVLVDDYDLVAPAGSASPNPLAALVEFLPQARDVGLHLVVARRSGGAGRALYDPVLGRLRELGGPVLVMNGDPEEGPLAGTVRPAAHPPGRGMLVDRRHGARLVQLAWWPPGTGCTE